MKIKDIQPNAKIEEIDLKLDSVDEPREVRDGALKVANAVGSDGTDTVSITFWNDDIDKVKTGDTIRIVNGWAREYQGQIQISTGKFGQLTVLQRAADEAPEDVDVDSVDDDIL